MVRQFVLGSVTLFIGAACLAALLVLFGMWDRVAGNTLSARVLIHPLQVPSTFSINDKDISDELVRRMIERAERDAALRIMLGDEVNKTLRERVIPRLLNAGVLRRMIQDMQGLGAVIDFAGYGSWAEIAVTNSGAGALEDVAITLPFAARAETASGEAVEMQVFDGGLGAASFGSLAAGETTQLRVWFEAPAQDVASRSHDIRIGADGGVRGKVSLYDPARGWNGAELEIEPWARWLIAGVLAFAACAAFAALILLLVSLVRPKRINRA